jgi:hypothetical protein
MYTLYINTKEETVSYNGAVGFVQIVDMHCILEVWIDSHAWCVCGWITLLPAVFMSVSKILVFKDISLSVGWLDWIAVCDMILSNLLWSTSPWYILKTCGHCSQHKGKWWYIFIPCTSNTEGLVWRDIKFNMFQCSSCKSNNFHPHCLLCFYD